MLGIPICFGDLSYLPIPKTSTLPALRASGRRPPSAAWSRPPPELHTSPTAPSSSNCQRPGRPSRPGLLRRHGKRLTVTEDGCIYALRLPSGPRRRAAATADVLSRPARSNSSSPSSPPSAPTGWCAACPSGPAGLKITLRPASISSISSRAGTLPSAWPPAAGKAPPRSNCSWTSWWRLPAFNSGRAAATPAGHRRRPAHSFGRKLGAWHAAVGPARQPFPAGPVVATRIWSSRPCARARAQPDPPFPGARRGGPGRTGLLSDITVPYANPYWLVWPQRSEGTAKLAAFRGWLENEVRDYRREAAAPVSTP